MIFLNITLLYSCYNLLKKISVEICLIFIFIQLIRLVKCSIYFCINMINCLCQFREENWFSFFFLLNEALGKCVIAWIMFWPLIRWMLQMNNLCLFKKLCITLGICDNEIIVLVTSNGMLEASARSTALKMKLSTSPIDVDYTESKIFDNLWKPVILKWKSHITLYQRATYRFQKSFRVNIPNREDWAANTPIPTTNALLSYTDSSRSHLSGACNKHLPLGKQFSVFRQNLQ